MVREYLPLYTVKETSEVLKVSPGFVYEEIKAGRLPCIRLGSLKVRGSDLEGYIEKYPVVEGERDEKKD